MLSVPLFHRSGQGPRLVPSSFFILLVMQMVERLIEAGANVQLVDVRGYTALQCAAEGGHMGPFRNLLQAGCDPMAQDHAGVSVLHSACQGGCLEIINHLQSLGADPSDRTLQGRDCLHYAALGETPHIHFPAYQPLHFKAATLFLPRHALLLCNEAHLRACSCVPSLPPAKVYMQLSEHRCIQQCFTSGSSDVTGLILFASLPGPSKWSTGKGHPLSTLTADPLSHLVTGPMRVLVVQVGRVQPLIIC